MAAGEGGDDLLVQRLAREQGEIDLVAALLLPGGDKVVECLVLGGIEALVPPYGQRRRGGARDMRARERGAGRQSERAANDRATTKLPHGRIPSLLMFHKPLATADALCCLITIARPARRPSIRRHRRAWRFPRNYAGLRRAKKRGGGHGGIRISAASCARSRRALGLRDRARLHVALRRLWRCR